MDEEMSELFYIIFKSNDGSKLWAHIIKDLWISYKREYYVMLTNVWISDTEISWVTLKTIHHNIHEQSLYSVLTVLLFWFSLFSERLITSLSSQNFLALWLWAFINQSLNICQHFHLNEEIIFLLFRKIFLTLLWIFVQKNVKNFIWFLIFFHIFHIHWYF